MTNCLNQTHCGRTWRVLAGLFVVVLLAGCIRAPAPTAVPLATVQVAPLVTSTPSATPVAPTHTPSATSTTVPTVTQPDVPTDTPVPTPTLVPSGTPAEVYRMQSIRAVVGVAPEDVLNVRAGPGVANPIVGAIPPYGMGVRVTGDGQSVGPSFWAPVVYGELAGWVNTQYLARQIGQIDAAVAARANEIVHALRDRDWASLVRTIHPEQGVRFSPYAYVRAGTGALGDLDRVVQADEIVALAGNSAVFRWGRFDGTGEPIDMTFIEYVDRFVYDVDYAQPHIVGYGETVGRGNTLDNIVEVYPTAMVVEYHFTGFDPALMGIDWRSLRLVLEQKGGEWYLVGIVHDEWTI